MQVPSRRRIGDLSGRDLGRLEFLHTVDVDETKTKTETKRAPGLVGQYSTACLLDRV